MVKIAFIDLDGTLLNDQLQISQDNIEALNRLHDVYNTILVLATGRSMVGLPNAIKTIWNLFSYAIFSNGATVYDCVNKKVLFKNLIDNKVAIEILRGIYQENVVIDCLIDGKWNIDEKSIMLLTSKPVVDKNVLEYILHTRLRRNNILDYLFSMGSDIEKIAISFECEKRTEIETKLCKILPYELITDSDKKYKIDVYSSTATKGIACNELIQYLGIDRQDAVAFGNDKNDISMFELCGIKIAVENSVSELKQKASWLCASNNRNGVAHGISELEKRF